MKNLKQPVFEDISPAFGSSLHIQQFNDANPNKQPTWHIHPEMEIVYVNGGSGKRHIGNHLSYYNDGDLIMIGANLPHFGFTDRLTAAKNEVVVQMREDFLGERFFEAPEFLNIKRLLERARRGVVFHDETKHRVGRKMEELVHKNSFERLMGLLYILNDLAVSKEYALLNIDALALEIEPQDNARINVIYKFVRDNFKRPISLEEISDKVNMTEPAFCRYFKKFSSKTFTQFVNEYRLVHASKLLSEGNTSITEICYDCGFNNFSHFNKQFKQFTGKSPSEYRKELKKVIS